MLGVFYRGLLNGELQTQTGRALGNPVLITEGHVTLIDGVLAVAVLAGLALNAAFGVWRADPWPVRDRLLRSARSGSDLPPLTKDPMIARLVAFVIPLGIDTFVVAAAPGLSKPTARQRVRIGALFAGFEGGTPVIGLVLGAPLGHVLGAPAESSRSAS